MNELKIYALLSELDEDIIESTLPPSLVGGAPAAPREREESFISRFLSSGWVAAVLSTVAALGLIIAIVLAGRMGSNTPPAGGIGESESAVEGETTAIENLANYTLVTFEFPDGNSMRYQSWYHSRTLRADNGELSTIDLGSYDPAVLDEGWIDTLTLSPGTAPTISHAVREGWLYTYTVEVYTTDMQLIIEADLADLAKMEEGTYCARVHFKGEGDTADWSGCVAFWLETWMKLEITNDAETLTETTEPPQTENKFNFSVQNLPLTEADQLTVSCTGRNPGEDFSVRGDWTLERVGADGVNQVIDISLDENSPDSFQAPSPDKYATGEVRLLAPALPSLGYGQYMLTFIRADGLVRTCFFYVLEEYTSITPAKNQPFRFNYSIEAPDGWGRGKTVILTLYQQNISDESIVCDTWCPSSHLLPYCQLTLNMGKGNLRYPITVFRDITEDANYYGVSRGEINIQEYHVRLPEDMPGGGRDIDLYIHYGDNPAWGVLYKNAFSEYGISGKYINTENDGRTPIREEWRVSTQQYNHELTTLPQGMPLSVKKVQTRIAALKDFSRGMIVRSQVTWTDSVYSVIVYDEGGREVRRGEDITILNNCEPNRTYYVDLITYDTIYMDGEDENGNWFGGAETRFEEYFFPFVRRGIVHTSPGVQYAQVTENSLLFTVTGLDESAMKLHEIIVSERRELPVTALADNAFTGCAATTVTLPRSIVAIGTAFAGCPSLTTIRYCGTVADWQAVAKPEGWAEGSDMLTRVICSDGEIEVG